MRAELDAGSSHVIAEAREGKCRYLPRTGEVREGLVQEILTQIPEEKIIWEAPQKAQQLYFLQLIGCNVNLGNIPPMRSFHWKLCVSACGARPSTYTSTKKADVKNIWDHQFPLQHSFSQKYFTGKFATEGIKDLRIPNFLRYLPSANSPNSSHWKLRSPAST